MGIKILKKNLSDEKIRCIVKIRSLEESEIKRLNRELDNRDKRVQKLPKFTHKIFKEAAEEREMEQMKMVEELFGEEMEKQKEILEMAKEESQEIMNQLKQQVLDKEKLAIQIEEEKQRAIKRNETQLLPSCQIS